VLATTDQGVLRSTDGGKTWTPLASAPPLFLAACADAKTVVGVTTKGGVAISVDDGQTWKTDPAKVTSGQALCASRDKAGCWRSSLSPIPERCSHTTTEPP